MVDAGTYRTDGETYDEWRKRKEAELDARKREAGIEQRLAAMERRLKVNMDAFAHFVGQRFGDERNKLADTFTEERSHLRADIQRFKRSVTEATNDDRNDFRGKLASFTRQVEELKTEVEMLRQALDQGKLRAVK